jgi:hypothetical protein
MKIRAFIRRRYWWLQRMLNEQLNMPYWLRKLNIVLTGNHYPWFVNVYNVDRCYGGPEEGGWWYDAGEPSEYFERASFGVESQEEAQLLKSALLARIEMPDDHHDRSSVIGDTDIEVYIEDMPAERFPRERPFYS